jgi:hypothetical protein
MVAAFAMITASEVKGALDAGDLFLEYPLQAR